MFSICSELTSKISNNRGGRLTERLLAQGLLTPAMLDELRNEWNGKNYKTSSTINEQKLQKKVPRRKRKT